MLTALEEAVPSESRFGSDTLCVVSLVIDPQFVYFG